VIGYGAMMTALGRKFKKHNGKLIMCHGWNDQLIQPYNSIDYLSFSPRAPTARRS